MEVESLETDKGVTNNQAEIKTEIAKFYKTLYEEEKNLETDSTLYQNSPKISP